jgi:ribose transport system permease protein
MKPELDVSASPAPPVRKAPAAPTGARGALYRLTQRRESAIFLALVVLVSVTGFIAPDFVSGDNLYLMSRDISFVAMVAIGQLFVILHGGIDLSCGSVMGLAGMAAGYCMQQELNPLLAVGAGIFAGMIMGAINGILVAWVRLTPFIVTLGMLSFASGIVLGLSKGWPITEIPESFMPVSQGSLFGIPMPVLFTLILAVIAHIALTSTAFGRRTFAMGGNEQATFLSGINVARIKFFLYVISAACASIAGIILVSRFNSAQADTGKGWELNAIAAAVIGGTSLSGGAGSVLGVLIGACIMGVIQNGLVLMKVSSYWQTAIIGVVIVLAAVLDRAKRKG